MGSNPALLARARHPARGGLPNGTRAVALPGLHVAFTIAYHLPPISHHLFPILWYNAINIRNACASRMATGQETAAVPSDQQIWMCERVISKQGFCFYLSPFDFPLSTTLCLSTPGSKTLKGARND